VIVHCNFEELTALKAGARQVLGGIPPENGAIAAPPEERELVAALLPRLGGDFSMTTLAEQGSLLHAVATIVEMLRVEMESMVATNHPAHEVAVSAYFDFAHAFSVQARLYEVGLEMEALVELVTGGPVTDALGGDFAFPD
jgi:hypothetical protein